MQKNIKQTEDTLFMEKWFSGRKIYKDTLDMFGIYWGDNQNIGGGCIVIPINETHNKYRRDPRIQIKPKYMSDTGLKAELFGAKFLKEKEEVIVITEGEIDCLSLWSHNIKAVSGTAGSMTFKEEWAELLKNTDAQIIIALDNDEPGATGTIRILKLIPNAKVLLIPNTNQIKDISDYLSLNGDIHELLTTAKHYESIDDIYTDRSSRKSNFQSTVFHDVYIDQYKKDNYKKVTTYTETNPDAHKTDAKLYPIHRMINFNQNKACCIFHNEDTPSMQYYPLTNSVYCFGCGKYADAITVARTIYNLSYKEAIIFLKNI